MISEENEDLTLLPRTPAEARETGSMYYFTGKPCKSGHISKRYLLRNKCYECSRIANYKWYKNNREESNRRSLEWKHENRELHNAAGREWKKKNPDKVKANVEKRKNDPLARELDRQYKINNRGKANMKKMEGYYNNEVIRTKILVKTNVYNITSGRGFTKKSKTGQMIGCSWSKLTEKIANKFYLRINPITNLSEDMTWENRSYWELDHIVAVGFACNIEEIEALNHYSNFQPLWPADHVEKTTVDRRLMKIFFKLKKIDSTLSILEYLELNKVNKELTVEQFLQQKEQQIKNKYD